MTRPGQAAPELHGLTEAEARARLAADGPNELAADRRPSLLATAWRVVREPMLLLLLGGATLYFVLGDVREAVTLLVFVVAIVGLSLRQERKSERALGALRDLSSPRASVIRDGVQRKVPGREVVRGDLLALAEGDRVPADVLLVDGEHLEVDEALLTGESVPVRKRRAREGEDPAALRPGGDDVPACWSGTLVVRGRGLARVFATGARSELGRIGRSLAELETQDTPLQREIERLVRVVAIGGGVVCFALFLVRGLADGEWLQGLLAGIALAMALLPEEFPVVLSVFFALGAWRIAKQGVLTRQLAAIEALGAATVLCTDKTGTLTQNRMRVAALWSSDAGIVAAGSELPEPVHPVVEYGILASQRDPFDPMEVAFHALGREALEGTEHLHDAWELAREYPLSPELLSVAHVWLEPGGGPRRVVAAKGAPEAIADLCHLAPAESERVLGVVRELAGRGLRVLAVARARFEGDDLPRIQHDFDFELVGLVGLADPLRPEIPAAVAECRAAGIRVVLVTGDHAGTARAIADEAGLAAGGLVTGPELDLLDDAALAARAKDTAIFARVVPEQKLRIVRALKAQGEVVAMTGDGVNDAPALKAAHIGVAMGGRGTDVAREAAALVLTEDDFGSLVAAVRLGRRIYANLRRALAFTVAVHVPIAGMALVPVLLGWPLALLPVHIVFLELIIDPSCTLAFEAEPEDERTMKRRPRDPRAPVFDRRLLAASLLQGAGLFAATLAVFGLALDRGASAGEARALAFATLVAGDLALIASNRSWEHGVLRNLRVPNTPARVIFLGAALVLAAALFVPFLRELFQFDAVRPRDLVLALGASLASLAWFEITKRFVEPRRDRGAEPGLPRG
ncbi:MAG: cation-translocating P-type ATPase [Planctomycetes bacterium]|nr:cation-translocating P-type ATPase [Planctomycetota bacterium]